MNRGEKTIFAAAARDPKVATNFDAFGTRQIGPARMFATTMPRAVMVNARHALRGGARGASRGEEPHARLSPPVG